MATTYMSNRKFCPIKCDGKGEVLFARNKSENWENFDFLMLVHLKGALIFRMSPTKSAFFVVLSERKRGGFIFQSDLFTFTHQLLSGVTTISGTEWCSMAHNTSGGRVRLWMRLCCGWRGFWINIRYIVARL